MTHTGNMDSRKTAPRERLVPNPKARLREQLHEVCRFKHLSARTEEAYWGWLRRFLIFHKQGEVWWPPKDLGTAEVQAFLSHLAVERKVAASTQNQALNALVFCYLEVLGVALGQGLGVRSPLDVG